MCALMNVFNFQLMICENEIMVPLQLKPSDKHPADTFQLFHAAVTLRQSCQWCLVLQLFIPTLQHEEPDHPVQVDVLVLPLQEGCSPGEAAQDVIDHLRPTPGHCGKQSQHCGQLEPRCPHLLTRINPVWRLRDRNWERSGEVRLFLL